jgi:RimJ/RimL family protein N-acetyltransferase
MKLIDAYTDPEAADVLMQLLAEREPHVNISHKRMPTWDEHRAFIASRPYPHWYVLDVGEDRYAGAAYLTDRNEIGIGILKRFRRRSFGRAALLELMRVHPGRRYLANIAPGNHASRELFCDLGFEIVQHTYALEPKA